MYCPTLKTNSSSAVVLVSPAPQNKLVTILARCFMATGIYSNNFSTIFSKLLEKSGVTRYQISQYAHLNEAYLSRLKNGEKKNPSPETIVKISLAICYFSDKVKLTDIEELFNSTGRSLHIQC